MSNKTSPLMPMQGPTEPTIHEMIRNTAEQHKAYAEHLEKVAQIFERLEPNEQKVMKLLMTQGPPK